MKTYKIVANALIAVSFGASANAAVVGDTVTGSYFDITSPGNFVVENGGGELGLSVDSEVFANDVEFILQRNSLVTLDIDETTVTMSFGNVIDGINSATWSVIDFTDTLTDLVLAEGNASLIDADNTGIIGGGDGFEITFFAIPANAAQEFVFNLTTDQVSNVPLPASIVLLLGGIGLLGFTSRRKA